MRIFIVVAAQWPKGPTQYAERENGTRCSLFLNHNAWSLLPLSWEVITILQLLGSPTTTTTPIKPFQDDPPHCNTTSQDPPNTATLGILRGAYWTILLVVLLRAYSSTESELFLPSPPRKASPSQHSFGGILPSSSPRADTGILIKC